MGPTLLTPREGLLADSDLETIARAYSRGGLLAFPTDTVYGVGAPAGDPPAIRRLFEAKRRPPDRALPVLIADREDVATCATSVPDTAWALTEAFWPGPLTIVLRRTDVVCPEAVAGGDTVGLRMPDSLLARQVLRAAPGPMAVTSANPSGAGSTVDSPEVLRSIGPWLDVLVEGPDRGSGVPSTVIDLTVAPPAVLRSGAVTLDQITRVIGDVVSPGGRAR